MKGGEALFSNLFSNKIKFSFLSAAERKERKKKVKVKLPGQPKRNMSAYFIWMNENREKIKAKYPELTITEFGKKAGELWKAIEDKSVRK